METARWIDRWALGVLFATAGVMAGGAGLAAAPMAGPAGLAAAPMAGGPGAPGAAAAQASSTRGFCAAPFADGERLCYKVRWGPIRLATLTITQERAPGTSSRYVVRMSGETRPGLPFLDLVFANRAVLRPENPTSRDFEFETGRGERSRIAYRYDGVAGELTIEENDEKGTRTERIPHQGPLYDGGGIFMLIRCLSGSRLQMSVPTIVDQEIHATRLSFTDDVKTVRSDAIPGRTRVRHFSGNADWITSSVAGLTGAFEGWLTDDDEAVLVQGSAKIFLGSITLDLESCERPGFAGSIAMDSGDSSRSAEGGGQ